MPSAIATRRDPEELRKYTVRRNRAKEAIERMPRGSKARCAFDLRLHPTRISRVLAGAYVSISDLEAVEGWLANKQQTV